MALRNPSEALPRLTPGPHPTHRAASTAAIMYRKIFIGNYLPMQGEVVFKCSRIVSVWWTRVDIFRIMRISRYAFQVMQITKKKSG
jgi:hypothetical protein